MNLDLSTAAVPAAAFDDLVIEDFAVLAAEPYQPGTCICWTPEVLPE